LKYLFPEQNAIEICCQKYQECNPCCVTTFFHWISRFCQMFSIYWYFPYQYIPVLSFSMWLYYFCKTSAGVSAFVSKICLHCGHFIHRYVFVDFFLYFSSSLQTVTISNTHVNTEHENKSS
jgi:hypothetical protein